MNEKPSRVQRANTCSVKPVRLCSAQPEEGVVVLEQAVLEVDRLARRAGDPAARRRLNWSETCTRVLTRSQ